MTCGHFALAAALIRSELKASLISPNRPRAGMSVRRIRPEPEPPNVKNDGGLWLEYGVGGGMVNRPCPARLAPYLICAPAGENSCRISV
jgi:hypothetical protein